MRRAAVLRELTPSLAKSGGGASPEVNPVVGGFSNSKVAERQQQALFRQGVRYAPLFHGFIRFVIERAIAADRERIYYLTREGEFFQQIHDRIAAATGARLPLSALLEVSRRSTFAASLESVTTTTLMRLWTLYSTQSVRALLVSLNLDPVPFAEDVRRHELALDEAVVHPWDDRRIRGFLADRRVADRLAHACAEQRLDLLGYLRERGITEGITRMAIVDIGWRGTIQDNLAHVLPSVAIDGSYLGLLRYLNAQPPNVTKAAFGPDENAFDRATLLKFVTPYEMLTNSASGSVTGYVWSASGVRAVRVNQPGEDVIHRHYTHAFQQGVLDAIPALEKHSGRDGAQRKARALRLWHDLAFNPPRSLASAYLALQHDETFGLGTAVTRPNERRVGLIARALVSRPSRLALEQWLDATTWPAGVLAAQRLRLPALAALRRLSLEPRTDGFDALLERRAGRRRWRHVVRQLHGRRVCCYGAGAFAYAVLRQRDLARANVVAFVDRDPAKRGRHIGGYPIVGCADLAALKPDVVLVTVFRNPQVVESVNRMVEDAGLECAVWADVWE
jgi:hypothetical protein